MELKAYQFEIYTCNEITGETGWDIKFRTVLAYSKKEAKELLRETPFFDCIILFNYCVSLHHLTDLEVEECLEYGFSDK